MQQTSLDPVISSNPLVAIVGAGPYGLSLASHLREAGVPFRIFGDPMHTWKTEMPESMKLKSDGWASNLSTGSAPYTLADFCRESRRPYAPRSFAIALEDFVAYGEEFTRRFVPALERQNLAHIARTDAGFHLTLADGSGFHAPNVVVATGLCLFREMPAIFDALPACTVTHTSDHRRFEQFAGRKVAVIGRGASSLNAAALLHEAGASVTLISRHPKIHIHHLTPDRPRPIGERLLHPNSALGYSKRSWMFSRFPDLIHRLPRSLRKAAEFKHLGPSGGHSLQGRVEGVFPILRGWRIACAEASPDAASNRTPVRLTLEDRKHQQQQLETDHVLVGTGFRADVDRLTFLDPALRHRITRTGRAPALNRRFESSVPGLYFIGPTSSPSFGPLLKFVAGAEFAATRVTRALSGQSHTPPA